MSARAHRPRRPVEDVGASAVEYGLLVAAVAALIVGTVFVLGTVVQGAFQHTCEAVAAGVPVDGQSCDGSGAGDPVPPQDAPVPDAP